MKIWLHRRGKPSWVFELSMKYGTYATTTAYGTVYIIGSQFEYGQPFGVFRLEENKGKKIWVSCHSKLRARSIEFENAGEYFFPKK